jgi:glutaredoxin
MITIYSKKGCPYCNKIKKVVELEELPHVVYELGRDYTTAQFYEKFGRGSTFPQLVLDGIHLGGCQESIKHMQRENICCRL